MSTRVTVARKHGQSGFSLVSAIFILVVLALLGAFIVTIGAVQHVTVTHTLEASRAYQAANAGVEWAIPRVLAVATRAATCGANASTPTTNAFSVSGTGLDGFGISVTCSYTRHQETSNNFCVYQISSVAQKGTFGEPYFVTRKITARVTDAPGSLCPA